MTYGPWCRAEGLRGAQHIAHRLALAKPDGVAICGVRILSVNLDSRMEAKCAVRGVTCERCDRLAWNGHGNEERLMGAYA